MTDEFEELQKLSEEDTSLEGPSTHPLEHLEELRRELDILLRPPVLQLLLDLSKALAKGPEQYSWFKRNSWEGSSCKYALQAAKSFKEKRLFKVKDLLKRCMVALEDWKE